MKYKESLHVKDHTIRSSRGHHVRSRTSPNHLLLNNMSKKEDDLTQRREELKIRKACIEQIKGSFKDLTTERLALLADYSESLIAVDEEALQVAEQQAIDICGYNPTEHISEHDWAVMQKRNEEALEIEKLPSTNGKCSRPISD